MKPSSEKTTAKIPSTLLLFAIGLFIFTLIVFFYKTFFHLDFNRELLQRKKVTFLLDSYQEDQLVMAAMINLYPSIGKAGVYFINPLIRFENSDKPLYLDGMGAGSKIKKNLESLTGNKIQYTFHITPSAFRRMIDLIEGLNVFTDPYTVRSDKNYDRNPGEYVMSGDDVYEYATVIANHDPLEYIHRISRQESILLTVYDKIHTITLPESVLKILHELSDTNLPLEDFISIDRFLQSKRISFSISELPAEPTIIPGTRNYAMDIKVDTVKTAYHQFESGITSDYFIDGEKSRIEVLNFTEVDGLARKVKSILLDKRLKVLSSSNGWETELKTSIVVDRSGNTEYSIKTAEALGINEIRHAIRKDIGMDTSVLLGDDIGEKYKN